MKRPLRAGPTLGHVIQTLRTHLPELRERYSIKSLGIFGSYARDKQKPRSDLDVLVEFLEDAKPNLLEFAKLQQELSDVLGVKVDLVEKKGLKPYIGKRILEEVIYLSEPGGVLSENLQPGVDCKTNDPSSTVGARPNQRGGD